MINVSIDVANERYITTEQDDGYVRRRGHVRYQRRGNVVIGANRTVESCRRALVETARRCAEQDRCYDERDRGGENGHWANFERSAMARASWRGYQFGL